MNYIKVFKQIFYPLLYSFLIIFTSCNDESVNNYVEDRQAFEVKVWDYSDSHFFLDTLYKTSFLDYFNSTSISQQTSDLSVDDQSFEVWVQTDVTSTSYRKAALHIDLTELPANGRYADTLKSVPTPQQGIRTFGLVRKLKQSEYRLNKYAGYVSLKIDLPENYFAGVAYKRTVTGVQFGTISTDTNFLPTDTLVLKMIKVQNLIPANSLAWEMKLRNIYQLPVTNIINDRFELQIRYLSNGIYNLTFPINNLNAYLITIFGLDKYTNVRSGGPDNVFDYLPGSTIDPENGWVIFPTLEPFYDILKQPVFGVNVDPVYWYPEIYQLQKSVAKTFPNADYYRITGFANTE